MSKDPTPAQAEPAPTHLVVTEDVETYRKGMVVPNAPEIAKALGDKARPATPQDLGVAGIMTRG